MKQQTYDVPLTALADGESQAVMDWSVEHFGEAAADRYETLIAPSLRDMAENPHRPGAKQRSEFSQTLYTYHLAHSRDRVVTTDRVRNPRHLLLYRVVAMQVDILRILHDCRD